MYNKSCAENDQFLKMNTTDNYSEMWIIVIVACSLCFSYVSAMVPVKTMKEYDLLQEVTVLFSETVQR